MWSERGLFERLGAPAHLRAAARRTCRGKRRRPDVARFLLFEEREVERLEVLLATGGWRPDPFDVLRIRDPKPRAIARPSVRDRVVHQAVAAVLEPLWAHRLHPGDMASRPGHGAHRAELRARHLMQRFDWAVHLDVRAYFPSIDIGRLYDLIARHVRDPPFMDLVARILEWGATVYEDPRIRAYAGLDDAWPPAGRGLPMGTSTSQLWAAHVYLTRLDHFVTRELGVPGLIRYCDDILLVAPTRRRLWHARDEVAAWLGEHRGLRLKAPDARVVSCTGHLDFLGYRIRRESHEALPRALRRARGRVAASLHGRGPADLERSLASTWAVMRF